MSWSAKICSSTRSRTFFAKRVFGAGRKHLLTAAVGEATPEPAGEGRKAQLVAELAELRRVQDNLINELANLTPTGDSDVDAAWRTGIQKRFAAVVTEQRTKTQLLDALIREVRHKAPVDLDLLDVLPQEWVDLMRLPEPDQRRIYDAFHLDLRYNAIRKDVLIRVTITGETAPLLAATVNAVLGKQTIENATGAGSHDPALGQVVADALRAPGRAPSASASLPNQANRGVVVIEQRVAPAYRQLDRMRHMIRGFVMTIATSTSTGRTGTKPVLRSAVSHRTAAESCTTTVRTPA